MAIVEGLVERLERMVRDYEQQFHVTFLPADQEVDVLEEGVDYVWYRKRKLDAGGFTIEVSWEFLIQNGRERVNIYVEGDEDHPKHADYLGGVWSNVSDS